MPLSFGYSYTMRSKRVEGLLRTQAGSKTTARPIIVTDSNTREIIGNYESIKEAGDKLSIPYSVIRSFLRKNRGITEIPDKMNRIFKYNDQSAF